MRVAASPLGQRHKLVVLRMLLELDAVGQEDHGRGAVLEGVGDLAADQRVAAGAAAVLFAVPADLPRMLPQHDHRLARRVHAGVVVVPFGRVGDSVADEGQGEVETAGVAAGQRRVVAAQGQRQRRLGPVAGPRRTGEAGVTRTGEAGVTRTGEAGVTRTGEAGIARTGKQESILAAQRGVDGHGELLEWRAAAGVGLQARLVELPGDKLGRQLDPPGLEPPTLQLVGGEVVVGVGQALLHGRVIAAEDRLVRAGRGRESENRAENRQKPSKNRSSGFHRRHRGGLYVRTSKHGQKSTHWGELGLRADGKVVGSGQSAAGSQRRLQPVRYPTAASRRRYERCLPLNFFGPGRRCQYKNPLAFRILAHLPARLRGTDGVRKLCGWF